MCSVISSGVYTQQNDLLCTPPRVYLFTVIGPVDYSIIIISVNTCHARYLRSLIWSGMACMRVVGYPNMKVTPYLFECFFPLPIACKYHLTLHQIPGPPRAPSTALNLTWYAKQAIFISAQLGYARRSSTAEYEMCSSWLSTVHLNWNSFNMF